MRMGLQVGFGSSIADVLPELKERGFQMVRIDCQDQRDPALAQEVLDAGLEPLVIIRSAEQIAELPEGVDIEVGNEPDIRKFGWTDDSYRAEVLRAIPAAENRNRLLVGVVSNLNARGFNTLEALPWRDIPAWVGCSIHRYPDDAGPNRWHLKTWFGARLTRDDEIRKLRKMVGHQRPLGLSEIGYHTAWRIRTDEQVAECMAWERAFFTRHGFDFAVAFQINDGHDENNPEHRYGFRRIDGSWKPVTDAWAA